MTLNQAQKKRVRKKSKITPYCRKGDQITVKFVVDGHRYRFNPVPRGKWGNDFDIAKAHQVCKQIETDLTLGHFDPTLEKYKPVKIVKPGPAIAYNVLDLYLEYLVGSRREEADMSKQVQHSFKKVRPALHELSKANQLLSELKKHYQLTTLKRVFVELRASLNWHIKQGKNINNPFGDIVQKLEQEIKGVESISTKTKQAATTKDIETIIAAFKDNAYSSPKAPKDNHSYYTNFVRFLFATGCRPEDARAIAWSDIVEKGGKRYLKFSKAYTQTGKLKATKNKTVRLFPINSQLESILDEARDQNNRLGRGDNKLIFPSKKGKYINGRNFQRRHFKEIVNGLVKDGKISKYITQGNGRHSFVTAMRSKGIPDAVIGALVETSPEMIARHYCDDDGLVIDLELPEI